MKTRDVCETVCFWACFRLQFSQLVIITILRDFISKVFKINRAFLRVLLHEGFNGRQKGLKFFKKGCSKRGCANNHIWPIKSNQNIQTTDLPLYGKNSILRLSNTNCLFFAVQLLGQERSSVLFCEALITLTNHKSKNKFRWATIVKSEKRFLLNLGNNRLEKLPLKQMPILFRKEKPHLDCFNFELTTSTH